MPNANIFGKTSGLKVSEARILERLYRRHIRGGDLLSSELADNLAEAANQTGRLVGVLANRKGEIEQVILGEQTRLYLPDIGRLRAGAGRLRGLRLIVAKPSKKSVPEYHLDHDFVIDLERLQLDAVVQIEVTSEGEAGRIVFGRLRPKAASDQGAELRHDVDVFARISDVDVDFTTTIQELETQLRASVEVAKKKAAIPGQRDPAVLVGVYTVARKLWEPSMEELKELAKTAGAQVLDIIIQQRKVLDPRTVVGKGKLEEICLQALQLGAEVLIFDCDLSPSQLNAITDLTDLKILDRTMLIMDIFARRAKTRSGKVQVELAQLKYSLPRLAKKQTGLSRLTGGIGGQGPGETKLEVDRRRAKDRIARLEREIEGLQEERTLRRRQRVEKSVPSVAIVGYTNAGKSTLLNALTGADVYVENQLFATLDPTSRRLRFPKEREVVLTDTVGFIRDLPEGLIQAFRATLDELHDADLLLHVVDATDPERERHVKVVNEILEDIEVEVSHRILVLNKCDLLTPEEAKARAAKMGGMPVSATKKDGLLPLLKVMERELWHAKRE